MSVQFGRWNFDGACGPQEYIAKVSGLVSSFAPDRAASYSAPDVDILFRFLDVTAESQSEIQPFVSPPGAVISWDGRLDNGADLHRELDNASSKNSSAVAIVAAAFERWGSECFAKFIGDWAVSIWNPRERSLLLAKDPVGTRPLYYSLQENGVTWCSLLDPLVLLSERSLVLEEEYLAGWLSLFPAVHLTPYAGIESVPPSCFVRLEPGRREVTQYWHFDANRRIRYRTDADYEEHFRSAFSRSVRRRLRSAAPVVAELSGGIDSASIVCVADTIIARGEAECPRLDTVSYYNDTEPNWNERPYFTRVEELRGRTGCHIDISAGEPMDLVLTNPAFAAMPASRIGRATKASLELASRMAFLGSRVLMSGTGGDEIMGGVPTPSPELMDLLAQGRLRRLAERLNVWALHKRKPWIHLLWEAGREFLPPAVAGLAAHARPAPWIEPSFARRHWQALTGYPSRVSLTGPLPSFQQNVAALDLLRRQMACSPLPSDPAHEKRFPYLDRDLLEFVNALPREQLVRPAQRRSLMRRALAGIVPDEILNRRRKAFVVRSPMTRLAAETVTLKEMTEEMVSVQLGIVNQRAFKEAVERTARGEQLYLIAMLRTLRLELWLRSLTGQRLLKGIPPRSKSAS
jgi:asparagine synthase (glutamine-hydrolysing)